MQIFRDLAGYSLGRADIVRRAMAKKKHDVLEREREVFLHGQVGEGGQVEIDGCLRRGVDEATAQALFQEIESFASYAFNKSHAAGYAVVAYQTAYLKCHYPCEYMAALLSSVLGQTGKVSEYIEECGRLGISVLPPHVNFSEAGFTVVGKSIRFGLLAVKNLGRGVIARMVEERRGGGEFTSFYNFCKRMAGRELNRRAIESLIKCGALDNLGNNRREMLLSVESVLDALEADKRRNVEGQMGFFDTPGSSQAGEPPLDKAEDFSAVDKLNMEKEVTGMYLSGHPMSAYAGLYQEGGYARMDEILQSAGEEGGPLPGWPVGHGAGPCHSRAEKGDEKQLPNGLCHLGGHVRRADGLGVLPAPGAVRQPAVRGLCGGGVRQAQLHRGEGAGAGVPVHGQARRAHCGGGRLRQAGTAGALPAAGVGKRPPLPQGHAVHCHLRRGLHPAVPHLPGHGQTAAGPGQIPGGYEPPPAACPARAAGERIM